MTYMIHVWQPVFLCKADPFPSHTVSPLLWLSGRSSYGGIPHPHGYTYVPHIACEQLAAYI